MPPITASSSESSQPRPQTRVRVFVDYWNFQLSLNSKEAEVKGLPDYRFKVNWKELGPWLARKACALVGVAPENHSFQGVVIYASFNPGTTEGAKFHRWATTFLNRQPGIQVECRERKPRALPKCPECHRQISNCPYPGCGKRIVSTVEKGVDTLIATDMIRLPWENAYDVAVLATSDSDLVPAVKFLNLRGLRVIQAGFPPSGTEVATACWASFDVFRDRTEILRT